MLTPPQQYLDTYQAFLSHPTRANLEDLTPLEFERIWKQMTPLKRFLLGARLWAEEDAS